MRQWDAMPEPKPKPIEAHADHVAIHDVDGRLRVVVKQTSSTPTILCLGPERELVGGISFNANGHPVVVLYDAAGRPAGGVVLVDDKPHVLTSWPDPMQHLHRLLESEN